MNAKKVKLSSGDFFSLLNVLNEVCYGIKINNFKGSIGAEKQTVIVFMDAIAKEQEKNEVCLNLNDLELTVLKKSFDEVFRQIEEWEFQTRIGISKKEARKIQDMLN